MHVPTVDYTVGAWDGKIVVALSVLWSGMYGPVLNSLTGTFWQMPLCWVCWVHLLGCG